jgi:hypothetical protein
MLVTTAFAQYNPINACRSVFHQPSFSEERLLQTIERPFLNTLIQNQYNGKLSPEFLEFETLNPQQKFGITKERLQSNGVEFDVLTDAILVIFKKQNKIQILPKKNGVQLNELAFILKKQLNVNLIYNPFLLDTLSEAYFLPETMELGLSDLVAFTGLPNISLYHEIRHAHLTNQLYKGQPTLYEGYVINSESPSKSKFPYDKFLSFQEVSTYYQDSKYHLLAIKQPSFKELPSEEKIRMVFDSQLMVKLAIRVVKLCLQRLELANEILNSGKGSISIKKSLLKNKYIRVVIEDDQYKFLFVVPTNGLYRKGLEEPMLTQHLVKMKKDFKNKLEKLEEINLQLEQTNPF